MTDLDRLSLFYPIVLCYDVIIDRGNGRTEIRAVCRLNPREQHFASSDQGDDEAQLWSVGAMLAASIQATLNDSVPKRKRQSPSLYPSP